jgi:hypothetical protein
MPRQVRALRRGARSVYSGGASFRGIPCGVGRGRAPNCECRGPWLAGLQRSIPSDPGIRGPLHPPRRRCPPSPYRCGYASVGRLAGCGASILSVLGLFRNAPLDAGNPPHCLGSPGAGVSPWENPGGRKGAGCGFGVPLPRSLRCRTHFPFAGNGTS